MPNCISSEQSYDKDVYTVYGCAVDRGGVSGGGGGGGSSSSSSSSSSIIVVV